MGTVQLPMAAINDESVRRHVLPAVGALFYAIWIRFTRYRLARPARTALLNACDGLRIDYDPDLDPTIVDRLEHIEERVDGQSVTSIKEQEILAGWRDVHALDVKLVARLERDRLVARLIAVSDALARRRPAPASSALRAEMDRVLAPPPTPAPAAPRGLLRRLAGHPPPSVAPAEPPTVARLRAVLGEALRALYNRRDAYFEALAGENQRASWLAYMAAATVAALGLAFQHGELFLLGAVGGMMSRLARVRRRRPVATDYGISWAQLMLSPVAGALAAWTGVLLLGGLQDSGVAVFGDNLAPTWKGEPGAIELVFAFVLGFSERLFIGVVTSTSGRLMPEGEDSAEPAPAPADGGESRRPRA